MEKPQMTSEKKKGSEISQETIDELSRETHTLLSYEISENHKGIKIKNKVLLTKKVSDEQIKSFEKYATFKNETELKKSEKNLTESLKNTLSLKFPFFKKMMFLSGLAFYT